MATQNNPEPSQTEDTQAVWQQDIDANRRWTQVSPGAAAFVFNFEESITTELARSDDPALQLKYAPNQNDKSVFAENLRAGSSQGLQELLKFGAQVVILSSIDDKRIIVEHLKAAGLGAAQIALIKIVSPSMKSELIHPKSTDASEAESSENEQTAVDASSPESESMPDDSISILAKQPKLLESIDASKNDPSRINATIAQFRGAWLGGITDEQRQFLWSAFHESKQAEFDGILQAARDAATPDVSAEQSKESQESLTEDAETKKHDPESIRMEACELLARHKGLREKIEAAGDDISRMHASIAQYRGAMLGGISDENREILWAAFKQEQPDAARAILVEAQEKSGNDKAVQSDDTEQTEQADRAEEKLSPEARREKAVEILAKQPKLRDLLEAAGGDNSRMNAYIAQYKGAWLGGLADNERMILWGTFKENEAEHTPQVLADAKAASTTKTDNPTVSDSDSDSASATQAISAADPKSIRKEATRILANHPKLGASLEANVGNVSKMQATIAQHKGTFLGGISDDNREVLWAAFKESELEHAPALLNAAKALKDAAPEEATATPEPTQTASPEQANVEGVNIAADPAYAAMAASFIDANGGTLGHLLQAGIGSLQSPPENLIYFGSANDVALNTLKNITVAEKLLCNTTDSAPQHFGFAAELAKHQFISTRLDTLEDAEKQKLEAIQKSKPILAYPALQQI